MNDVAETILAKLGGQRFIDAARAFDLDDTKGGLAFRFPLQFVGERGIITNVAITPNNDGPIVETHTVTFTVLTRDIAETFSAVTGLVVPPPSAPYVFDDFEAEDERTTASEREVTDANL